MKALKLLRAAGYKLILVTNQSGVARGYLTVKKLNAIHSYLKKLLLKKGAKLDAVYFCPHGPDSKCFCRKPKLGMVRLAQKRFNIDMKRSYSVGDHTRDFLLGQNMGGKGIFVLTGHGKEELKKIRKSRGKLNPHKIFRDFLAAAKYIVKN